jgi:predicted flavoprotein YhiN
LRERLPERLARVLCEHAGVDPATRGDALRREERRAVSSAVCNLELPITGSRGYTFAEVTAGGVPLSELHLDTMESRVCPGFYLCGEICDVDGRIGGFNFQWAWSSGFVAGTASATR